MKPFTELMDVILSPLKSSAIHGAANLAANIGTTVQLCITLYIILYGWQIARGEISEPWNEFAKRAVKLGLIVAILQSPALYKEYVIDFLAEALPDALSSAMSGNPVPDANKFDTLATKFGILLTQVWQGTGWSAPAATARAAVVTLLVMPFVWCSLIVGFVVTMWAKAGMYFVATLGPLFIAFAMFEQTRRYLHNWLDQIVTMIALQVLVAMTCGLVLEGLERAVKDAPTPENAFALAGKVIVLTVFSLAIWSSLPRLASKLGGYGASVAGAGSRAAPFDTMRAPIGSFSEHGAAPIGRPELGSIQARSTDGRTAAAIVPAPLIAPSGSGSGGSSVGSALASGSTSTESAHRESVGPTSGRSAAADAPPVAHASTATAHPATISAAGSHFQQSVRADGEPGASDRVPIGNGLHDAEFVAPASAQADAAPRVLTGAAEHARANQVAATAASTTLGDDAIIAEQRTGFEGIDFETPSTRAADTALIRPTMAHAVLDTSAVTTPAAESGSASEPTSTPRRST